MALIDWILNLAGLLLWLSWCSVRFDPLFQRPPASLVGTLRPAEPRRWKGLQFLVGLAALLLFRALLYWQVGLAADWTPNLELVFVRLAFRSDILRSEMLFSALSFLSALLIFYFWLLVLAIINRGFAESDSVQKLVRQHLGRVARWPRLVQSVLPLVVVAALWLALHPLLLQADITSRARSNAHLVEQSLLVGTSIYFSLKYLVPAFLLAHLVLSHVYLGSHPLLDFVSGTARNMLAPLRWLPLRIARLDLAPLAGAILVLLLLHTMPNLILRKMLERNLMIWPP